MTPTQMAYARPWRYVLRDAVLIGTVNALVLILVVVIFTAISGNQQQHALEQIRDGVQAQVCVAVLPLGEAGRDEAMTNTRCLIPYGFEPTDADGDGRVEFEGAP